MTPLLDSKNMNYYRSIIVGLGGMGNLCTRWAAKWIKDKMPADYFQLPPFLKILSFDTDSQGSGNNLPNLDPYTQFVNLGGFAANKLIEIANKEKIDDVPKCLHSFRNKNINASQIHSGAHGVPLIGRLCYVYRHKRIAAAIKNAVIELLHPALAYSVKEDLGVELETSGVIKVQILSSLCGGTGAGILIDTAIDLRDTIKKYTNVPPDICAHLVFPPIFGDAVSGLKELHERNTYYTIRQVDYLMQGKKDVRALYADGNTAILKKGETLFDNIFVINAGLSKIRAEKHIGRMAVAYTMEPIGMEINRTIDSLKSSFLPHKNRYAGYSIFSYKMPDDMTKNKILKVLFTKQFNRFIRENIVLPKDEPEKLDKIKNKIELLIFEIVDNQARKLKRKLDEYDESSYCLTFKGLKSVLKMLTFDDYDDSKYVWGIIVKFWRDTNEKSMINVVYQYFSDLLRDNQTKCKFLKGEIEDTLAEYWRTATNKAGLNLTHKLADKLAEIYKELLPFLVAEVVVPHEGVLSGQTLIDNISELEKIFTEDLEKDDTNNFFIDKPLWRLAPSGANNEIMSSIDWYSLFVKNAQKCCVEKARITRVNNSLIYIVYEMIKTFRKQNKRVINKAFVQNFLFSDFVHEFSQYIDKTYPDIYLCHEIDLEYDFQSCLFLQIPGLDESIRTDKMHKYMICGTHEKCDCVAVRMKTGISLASVKDMESKYKPQFKMGIEKDKQAWMSTLFDFDDKQDIL